MRKNRYNFIISFISPVLSSVQIYFSKIDVLRNDFVGKKLKQWHRSLRNDVNNHSTIEVSVHLLLELGVVFFYLFELFFLSGGTFWI